MPHLDVNQLILTEGSVLVANEKIQSWSSRSGAGIVGLKQQLSGAAAVRAAVVEYNPACDAADGLAH